MRNRIYGSEILKNLRLLGDLYDSRLTRFGVMLCCLCTISNIRIEGFIRKCHTIVACRRNNAEKEIGFDERY